MTHRESVILYCAIAAMSVAALVVFVLRKRMHWNVTTKVVTMVVFLLGQNVVLWILHSAGKIGKGTLENITLILASSAIAFAVWQFRDSQLQFRDSQLRDSQLRRDSQLQEERMQRLAREMSTRFVGFFPNNLRDINEVVGHANQKLDVMADYVGYGHFSVPEEFQRYFRELQDLAAKHVKIRMLVFTREEAQRTFSTQFTDEQFRDNLMAEQSPLARYCDMFGCGFGNEFMDKRKKSTGYSDEELHELREHFERFMFDRQLFYMKDLIERGVEIKQTSEKLPFFLWCEDDHEAVFGFLNEHSADEREVSFRTRDSSLIERTFEVKFEALWNGKQAEKIEMVDIQGHSEPSWLLGSSRRQAKDTRAVA
jgi:hypothetical protein